MQRLLLALRHMILLPYAALLCGAGTCEVLRSLPEDPPASRKAVRP